MLQCCLNTKLVTKLHNQLLRCLFPNTGRCLNRLYISRRNCEPQIIRRQYGKDGLSALRANPAHPDQKLKYLQVIPGQEAKKLHGFFLYIQIGMELHFISCRRQKAHGMGGHIDPVAYAPHIHNYLILLHRSKLSPYIRYHKPSPETGYKSLIHHPVPQNRIFVSLFSICPARIPIRSPVRSPAIRSTGR